MNKDEKNNLISQEEIKRRKSTKITVYPEMNIFSNNIKNENKSTSHITWIPPLTYKSNCLFAYQELDQFCSFCDNESFPSDILSYLKDQNQNLNSNNNLNNNSTKQEEYEESDSSSDDSINNEMSND